MFSWVPIDERQPETYVDVMVTGDYDKKKQAVCIAFVDQNGKWTENGGCAFNVLIENVTAWKPIPKLMDVDETYANEWRFICDELPEKVQECLVAYGSFGSYMTSICSFYPKDTPGKFNPKKDWGFICYSLFFSQLEDDVAWMPLPKPYKAEEEEKC